MSRSDFSEGGFFGFISDGEEGKVGIRRELLLVTFLEEVFCKLKIISLQGGFNDGVFGLKSLDDYFGMIKMTTTDAANDLREKFKGAFFGGKIGKRKTGIGLNDADASEEGKIEPAGEGLGANEEVNFTSFDFLIEISKVVRVFVVTIKTSDSSFWKEAS